MSNSELVKKLIVYKEVFESFLDGLDSEDIIMKRRGLKDFVRTLDETISHLSDESSIEDDLK